MIYQFQRIVYNISCFFVCFTFSEGQEQKEGAEISEPDNVDRGSP